MDVLRNQQQQEEQEQQQKFSEEMCEFGRIIDLFQQQGSSITKEQLLSAFKTLGYNPTDEELQEMIDSASDNEPDAIDMSYFLELINKKMKEHDSMTKLTEAFKMFDKDQNGFISALELRNAMKNMGQNLSDKDADSMIKLADVDGDGQVDYKEFVNMMMSKIES